MQLGLIKEGEDVQPAERDFNVDRLESSAKGLSPELRDVLKTHFGPQIEVEGGYHSVEE